MDVSVAVAGVRRRIASAGDPGGVRVVAVTKGFGADAVRAALDAGLADIGESYAQELVPKAAEVGAGPAWHFVGRLQTNKVRAVAGIVDVWQSVDRASLGDEIARWSPGARVLLQVNVTGEPQKAGCPPHEAAALVRRFRRAGLDVTGVMTVAKAGDPRPGFELLRKLADDLGVAERSMGMTDDLEVAVECGATIVRVGRALFGPRPG